MLLKIWTQMGEKKNNKNKQTQMGKKNKQQKQTDSNGEKKQTTKTNFTMP